MEERQSSRRKFLSSLAVLSACVPFASAATLFSEGDSAKELCGHWKLFCLMNGGKPHDELIESEYEAAINQCQGHSYRTGELIFFPKENIVAQPTWVYWGKEKSKPADVIITFYNNDPGKKNIFSINRFELEGLCKLSENNSKINLMALLCEGSQNNFSSRHENKLKIKTLVNKGDRVQIVASLSTKEILINKRLIYKI